MKETINIRRYTSWKRLSVITMVSALAIASLAVPSAWSIPEATASSLEEIKASREIPAPIDQVWNIVSDIDNETKYWSTFKSIKNINTTSVNMTANRTEREVTISAGPLGETATHQFVTVNPEQFVVQTNITEGPITGNRLLTLSPIYDANATRIDVLWKIDMSGIPFFGKGFAKDGILRTTEEALGKIEAEVY
jgi:uncharacterized protein YndB with AHSA1/START domain